MAIAPYLPYKHESGINLLIKTLSKKQRSVFLKMLKYFFKDTAGDLPVGLRGFSHDRFCDHILIGNFSLLMIKNVE